MNVKKLISMILALAMMLSLGAAAAEETLYTITIENAATGHTYEAYQIFTGDLYEGVLSNIVWGTGVTEYEGRGDAAARAEALTTANAAEFAKEVGAHLSTTKATSTYVAAAEGTAAHYEITGLKAGYYLVKDTDNSLSGAHDAHTSFILVVVKDETVAPKSSVPTVEKKVDDENDSVKDAEGVDGEDQTNWQDSADYDIGDKVPFKLTATLGSDLTGYKTYKVVFHDTLSAGLTYNDDFKVTIDGKDVTASFTDTYEGTALTFSCNDVLALGAHAGSVIEVTYTATLNEKAVIGAAGNPNTVYLEFSNNPNWEADGEDDEEPTGKTPEDKVIVFTYKVVVNKVAQKYENGEAVKDADGKPVYEPLAGAGFTLYKKNAEGAWVAVGEEKTGDELAQFVWAGLDDGDYKLEETTTPVGYNTIDPIEFTITAAHEIESDDPRLTALSGNVTSGEAAFTADLTAGSLTTTVINQKGATLPSTGAQGTKMIYMVGGILVAAAVVLLIAKRRANNAE